MRVGPLAKNKKSSKTTTVTIDRRNRVALPEGWLSLRIGQRVFFIRKNGGVQISACPKGGGLRNGRLISTRVRMSTPRRNPPRATYIGRIHLHFAYGAPKTVI